jgi:EAL domain-containing protein (putative c-di-GMP-specific phosphodiesterase class I)
MGCDAVQGFLFAQPMTAHLLQQWLAAGNGRAEIAEGETI